MPPELALLRKAAVGRDWGSLLDTLASLLRQMDYFYGLEMALKLAHHHLAVFEQQHPESGWARSLLVWLAAYGVAPANLPGEAGQPHQSPGAANYVSALLDLTRSAERQTPLENRIRFLANSIGSLIVADLAAFWYGQHPEMWDLQQQRGDEIDATGQTVRQGIYARFWLDEAVAERDTTAWLKVAEDIERRLK
jgi:hypothetical protein